MSSITHSRLPAVPLPALCAAALLAVLFGCGDASIAEPSVADGSVLEDAGEEPLPDAGEEPDDSDAGEPIDDAGEEPDDPDAGEEPEDAGAADAGAPGPVFHVPDNQHHEVLRFGSSPAVIFRWRADGTSTTPGTLSEGVTVSEVRRPSPFSKFRYASFQGSSSAASPGYVGNSAITTQDNGITIQAWFRARSVDGSRTLFSNTGSGKGFSLDVVDGRLRIVFSALNSSGTAHRYVVADTTQPVETGRWYHAVGTIAKLSDQFRVRLFLDGKRLLTQSIDFSQGNDLADSTEKPAVAAEPTSGHPDREGFDGDLHAVVVHNYPVDRDVLEAPQLRDGGRYFGAPSYHDYLSVPEPEGTAGATPPYSNRRYNLARRITLTDRDSRFGGIVRSRVRFGLPLLNDRFVPGGVALSEDGGTMWLGYSYLSDSGANPDGHASLIVEADLRQSRVTRIFRLVGSDGSALPGPVDGLASAKGFLYRAAGERVERFDLSAATLEAAGDPDAPSAPDVLRLGVADSFEVRSQGAGLSYDAERDALWVSAYRAPSAPASDGALDRYDLASSGAIARPSASSSDERILLPQGLAYVRGALRIPSTAAKGAGCFLVTSADASASSASPSAIHFFCPDLGRSVVRARIGYGARDLELGPDGTVWSVDQSGAAFYQKRTNGPQWYDALTPYVLGFALSKLTPEREACVEGDLLPFVGDLHTHTSFSDGCLVAFSGSCPTSERYFPDDLIAEAKRRGLDFLAITDHINRLSTSEFSSCRSTAASATAPGHFLATCGFELQVYPHNTMPSRDHTNVFFADSLNFDLARTTSISTVFSELGYCKSDGCFAQFNHPASSDYPYPDRTYSSSRDAMMALVELSGGSASNALTAYEDFLDRGWHVGPTADSDTHRNSPGNAGKRSGVYLASLDLATLKEGLAAGRTFASNAGNESSLELKAEGCWMGATLRGYLRAHLSVLGSSTASVGFRSIELRVADGRILRTLTCDGSQATCEHALDIDVNPEEDRYVFARAVRTDGTWLVSAPIWLAE